MQREPLSHRARGRWRGILAALGLERQFLTGKHGPCPLCKAGKDRFRFSDKEGSGSWICGQCGHGGGTDLVMRLKGLDFADAAKLIETVIGSAERVDKPKADPAKQKAAMTRLWEQSCPVERGSLPDRYLARRGVALSSYPPCLRDLPGTAPMMLAKVVSPEGKAVNVHRTYLAEPGVKAAMEMPRKMMPGDTALGSAARLFPIADTLGIAEGIETALSAASLFAVPVWALFNADNLSAFRPPESVTRLMIFGDNDENHHGQWAAEAAARTAHRHGITVEVRIPAQAGADWNDELLRKEQAA